MPKRSSSSSSSQRRAQGGGRTANSEPRLQVFRDFGGINFEHAGQFPDGIDMDSMRIDRDQTDLQMNYMFLQNNVATVSNKTMQTRDDIVTLFDAPSGVNFTGPVCLIGPKLYAAKSDGNIARGDLDTRASHSSADVMSTNLTLTNNTGSSHTWTSMDYYDNKLIAQTNQNEMWTGSVNSSYAATSVANAVMVPDPTDTFVVNATTGNKLLGKGSLRLSSTMTEECPFRIMIAYTFVNKYGPTLPSPNTMFYANHPVSEWHAGCYLQIQGTIPTGYGIKAVEMYYSTDDAMNMIFLGRKDVGASATAWAYNWFGYIDATSMWPMANLVMPTENYTKGVHASHSCNIDGRLYFWGDSSQPQRLYIGGNPGNLLSVSPGTGGGFVDVEPGTGQAVRYVCKYKTQSGNSIVTMLCDSPNSHREQRFNLVEDTVSLSNEQSMRSWNAEQVAGAVGCKSYDGAVVCQDGIYSVSRYGLALTTMTMEYNSQIQTNYVSDAIKPVFTDAVDMDRRLSNAMLLEVDGVIYMALGASSDELGKLDYVLFCYDIDLKAWWTYTLDVDSPILKLFHVDWQGQREGIGIVTKKHIYLLPTTDGDDEESDVIHRFLIESAQLSTQMPQQGWQYLSQLEFHFDWFVGTATINIRMVDMFGREIEVKKTVTEEAEQFDYVVHMRVDQRVMSYVIVAYGKARFRMTHFIARVYTLSNRIGQVWGFDERVTHHVAGDIHPTFKCYNDVRRAIFT